MSIIGKQISVDKEEKELIITILARRTKAKTTMLLLWLFLWSVSGVLVITQYLFGDLESDVKAVLIVWLGFWAYFEYKIIKAYLWRTKGKEMLILNDTQLIYKRDIAGRGKQEIYECNEIKNVRFLNQEDANALDIINNSYWSISGETVTFDYGNTLKSFGYQLKDKDAKELIITLKRALKRRG